MITLPNVATINEVGPRDGLQLEKVAPTTDQKIAWIDRLSQTGLAEIQIGAFVHPHAVPQLADTAEVAAGITRHPGVIYTALIPNLKGLQRAADAGLDHVEATLSLSDSHGRANLNATLEEGIRRFAEIKHEADRQAIQVRAGIATALGDHFEGFLPYERLERTIAVLVEEQGYNSVSLADTAGMADPLLTYTTLVSLRTRFPGLALTLHFHDTRRMALANVTAALQAGVTSFDSSIVGLGGCPFSPGASGNVATEDLVNMLDLMGIDHGTDLAALREAVRHSGDLLGKIDSGVGRAGFSFDTAGPYTADQDLTANPTQQ